MLFLQISFFKICCSSDYKRKDFFPNSLTHTSPQPKELYLNLSKILKISFPFHYNTLQLDPGRTTRTYLQDEN